MENIFLKLALGELTAPWNTCLAYTDKEQSGGESIGKCMAKGSVSIIMAGLASSIECNARLGRAVAQ